MKRKEISSKTGTRLAKPAIRRWVGLALGLLIAWACVLANAAAGLGAGSTSQMRDATAPPALRNGRELWATVNVCASKPHPMIGIRGSMPSDGHAGNTMYMLFRVQYLNATTKRWGNLRKGGESGLVKVGAATETRQAGRTFELATPPRGGSFQLRGIVEFQWREGSRVLLSVTRETTAGRHSSAGAVPSGFSAATCKIGG